MLHRFYRVVYTNCLLTKSIYFFLFFLATFYEVLSIVHNCTQIAIVVTLMYRNMNIDNLIYTTKYFLDQIDRTKYKLKVIKIRSTIFCTNYIGKHEFQFNVTLYKQVIGPLKVKYHHPLRPICICQQYI